MSGKIRTDSKTPSPINLPPSQPVDIPPGKSNKWNKPTTPKDCLMNVGEIVFPSGLPTMKSTNRWQEAQTIFDELNRRLQQAQIFLDKAEDDYQWSVYGTSPDSGLEILECKEKTMDLFQKAKGILDNLQKTKDQES